MAEKRLKIYTIVKIDEALHFSLKTHNYFSNAKSKNWIVFILRFISYILW